MKRLLAGAVVLAGMFLGSAGPEASAKVARRSDSVVGVQAAAGPVDAAGNQVVTVVFAIQDGWHIYANPTGNESFTATTVAVDGASEAQIHYPHGKPMHEKDVGDYNVYDGQVTVTATVRRAPGSTGPLTVTTHFQACCHVPLHETCLLPATVTITVP